MERKRISLIDAKKLFKNNFIGPEQLESIKHEIKLLSPFEKKLTLPEIIIDKEIIKFPEDYILVLGIPFLIDNSLLTINNLKNIFNDSSDYKKPFFYNQDWYLNEEFACKRTLEYKWYLLKKSIFNDSPGVSPEKFILKNHHKNIQLPSAILCTYVFFCHYFLTNGEKLWQFNYVWCSDIDVNNDQIYVGRYDDPSGVAKSGFSIHRHLKIRTSHGIIDML
ncbi:MAG: hypothetical protein HQK53_01025 [Oligoflexia bacterium]|nr:hypothetical protein [Oligoflexia bacterium]